MVQMNRTGTAIARGNKTQRHPTGAVEVNRQIGLAYNIKGTGKS